MPESPEQLRARLRAEIAAIEKGVPKPSRAPDLPHVREEREDRRPSRASRSLSASAAGGQPSRHDAGEVDEDVRLSDPDAAFRKIERLCLVRERASEQLRQRLARGGFEAEPVEAALDRALACGLVDDGRFADVLVRSRLAQGRGRRGIAAELESLGIDADGVEALAAADDDAGRSTVRSRCSTASRRARRTAATPPTAASPRKASAPRCHPPPPASGARRTPSKDERIRAVGRACGGGAALHFRLFLVRAFTIRAQPLSYGIA